MEFEGNTGVLAFNFFPNHGDMVFDAFNSFYDNTSNNSLRMRNVAAHEHGHGLGMNHVCPIQRTVLMEPFITVQFDGPQLDDILNGIRNYGDVAKPNDSIAQATDLGTIALGNSVQMSNIGIDAFNDDDYFRVAVSEFSRITLTATPDAAEYVQGPQTKACDVGDLTNYNTIQNLRVTVLDSSGNLLATSNMDDIGQAESLGLLALTAGEYFFVVDGDGGINNVQRYRIDVAVTDGIFIDPVIVSNAPDTIDPGVETPFTVTVNPQDDVLVPDSGRMFLSINGNPFVESIMIPTGVNSFSASFPSVECNDLVEYYLSVEGEEAGVVTFPLEGASSPVTVGIGDFVPIFADNFNTDMGWTVTGNVTGTFNGQWERGAPAGFGDRGDPGSDADGSGYAYLTGNAPGNTDVDGGQTILVSPAFEMLDNPEGRIFYSRWYDNTGAGTGSNPGEDVFTVQVSNTNGVSWVTVETVGPDTPESDGGWVDTGFLVSDFVVPNNQVRVRFIAEDIGNNSVIEAAVDGILTTGQACDDSKVDCIADFDNSGTLNFFDISAFLTAFANEDPAADLTGNGTFNFFDISAFLSAFAAGCP